MMVCHDEPPPLEGPLREFVEGAADGVIVVSFGSGVVMNSQMSPKNLETFINTFGGLKERVVWKWEGGREELEKRAKVPPNVYVSPWLPQQSLASHTNVKLIVMQVRILGDYHTLARRTMEIALPEGNIIPPEGCIIPPEGRRRPQVEAARRRDKAARRRNTVV